LPWKRRKGEWGKSEFDLRRLVMKQRSLCLSLPVSPLSSGVKTMMTKNKTKFRKFLLATITGGLHTALFAAVGLGVAFSRDPQATMGFAIFLPLDYPLSRLVNLGSDFPGVFLLGGGLLWFCYGFLIQALFSIRSRKDIIPIFIVTSAIAALFLFTRAEVTNGARLERTLVAWTDGKR